MWQVEATARRNYMSIEWTAKKLERLKELCISGYSNPDVGLILEKDFGEIFTVKAVEQAKYRNRLTQYTMIRDFDVPIFKSNILPDDNYMVSCDYHSPYHDEVYVNRFMAVADLFQIKKNIIIGDLVDNEYAKHWYSPYTKTLDKETMEVRPVIQALDYFDENILVHGNHEDRPGRMTDGKIQAKHLFQLFGKEVWDRKFKYTEYDKIFIGEKWLLVHPRSYSQRPPTVPKLLAEKFHRHVINSHGHLVGWSFDRSGKFQTIDLGGMFNPSKIEYINMHTTTHPMWKNGFGMIRDGHFFHFTDATDWDFWLRG